MLLLVISQEIWPYPGGWLSFFCFFCQDQANEHTAIVCKTGESFYARSIPTALVSSMVDDWGIPQVWWFQICSVTLW